jgi:hypothetical protein
MDMSRVQFLNNSPEMLGWPANSGYETYSWTDPMTGNSYLFPQGVYQGTGPIWDDLLNAIVPLIGIPGAQGIHPGGFGVAGTWGAENRDNVNDPGTVSFHACGRALDINAPWNPNGSGPQDGQPWGVPAAAGPIAQSKGFLWGGDFQGTSDPMHFELHLTPIQIAMRLAELATPSTPTAGSGDAPTPAPPIAPPTPAPALTGDWSDMASKEEVQQAVRDAQPVEVLFVRIGNSIYEHDVKAGTKQLIPNVQTLNDRKYVLTVAGVKWSAWAGGKAVANPNAFGRSI